MAPMSPKKRKSSDVDDDFLGNGSSGASKTKRRKGKNASTWTEAPDSNDPPFRVTTLRSLDDIAPEGAVTGKAQLGKDFEGYYAIESLDPDIQWKDVRTYRNVKLTETTFAQDDIVLILSNPKAPAPPPDPSIQEMLEYDKRYFFVAKILQARALSDKAVWLLVAYLYWPNEIPEQQKKQKNFYAKDYAQGELLMSDDFAIIDATMISSHTEIPYWDEWDDESFGHQPERFWRQIFRKGDFDNKYSSPTALGELRKFCRCRRPFNPDKEMEHCPNTACNQWNHAECLADEVGKKAFHSYQNGTMDQYARDNVPQAAVMSIADAVLQPVKALTKQVEHVVEAAVEAVAEETIPSLHPTTTNGTGKGTEYKTVNRGRPRKNAPTWQSRLAISIVNEADKPLIARIREKSGKPGRTWEVKVNCLCCGKTMD